jgi:UDP-N-acetylglucosamine--N-acetylmuramyl-(pentapeptide) pyrophosphoryl-undecaprenol N-acetylglucosamine transferase
MTTYLLAGGGTAGHVNPLLSLADEISKSEPGSKVIALGTSEGLESQLVPARGYELSIISKLPFPRKLNLYAVKFPWLFMSAVRKCQALIKTRKIEIVVGFGGYASAPAYLAAKFAGVPLVIHEANALPGWANKFGSSFASAIGVAFRNTPLKNAKFVAMPLREEITNLSFPRDSKSARQYFGLDSEQTTLLVIGGSLGAKKINESVDAARTVLRAAGIQVLHISGSRSDLEEISEPGYRRIKYCDRMDLAISASSFAVSRSGAATVSEFAAAGLPAVFVPYPVGNGEQELNAAELVSGGGAVLVRDRDFTPKYISEKLIPLISNTKQINQMASTARSIGVLDGTTRLFQLVQGVLQAKA